MKFVTKEEVAEFFRGKSVAIVGSGPSIMEHEPGFIDSFDIVVRVNNYNSRSFPYKTGRRTDVFYSFFGGSIRKTAQELKEDGVKLCMCKCPDDKFIESDWHKQRNKEAGVDFRALYRRRADFWFCDTYIPTTETFLNYFHLLGKHVPTTGFQAILEILSFDTGPIYITGFDFFQSKIHNLNQPWIHRNPDDPIAHVPAKEFEYICKLQDPRVSFDPKLAGMIRDRNRAVTA